MARSKRHFADQARILNDFRQSVLAWTKNSGGMVPRRNDKRRAPDFLSHLGARVTKSNSNRICERGKGEI